jgi:phosphohistidine swiveling domain-containing protein
MSMELGLDHAPVTEAWNDSLTGDYLWSNANLGEAVPDVMTPCTWSLLRVLAEETAGLPSIGGYPLMGNIGGRFYMNLSVSASLAVVFGMKIETVIERNSVFFGLIPAELEIPLIPFSRWRLLPALLPEIVRVLWSVRVHQKRAPAFLASASTRCDALHAQIKATSSTAALVDLWRTDIEPFFRDGLRILRAVAGGMDRMLRSDLLKLVGEADTNALMSGLSADKSGLASLGPLLGLEQLARGEIDRETYARQYGHRSEHEFEVSLPRPAEESDWIAHQLAGMSQAVVDTNELLVRQQKEHAAAWERFRRRYPNKARAIRRRIDRTAQAVRQREAARSELIRIFWVLRAFVLRAGALTGQGDALFFLSTDEILAVLSGDNSPLAHIPQRRALHARYSALPSYPTLICGRFDPFKWAADPHRRSDIFDGCGNSSSVQASTTIKGFAGAPGIVEGRARVISTTEEGEQLQPGEILVTTVTNIGWTPLFPRAAAVVTDVGAPLSHAAIVARELGIPAVVGCGNATMRLHTGDRIRVNGELGTVELLQAADAT